MASTTNSKLPGKEHKDRVAAWQQAQKDRAAWQQRLDKSAEDTAERRAGQTAGPKLHALVASTYKHLQLGSPITDVSAERPFLGFTKVLHIPELHWAMKYLKNPQRNSIKEQHLTACVRAFKSNEFSIALFSYPAAIGNG
eukprot:530196-Pelagomonas_calceolata.AAC.3